MRVATPSATLSVGLFALVLGALVTCGREAATTPTAARSFDEELALVVRAGRGELPDGERRELVAENHPLLAQIGDPNTVRLIELFARLPADFHERLQAEGYLKWNVAELDAARRELLREMIQLNIDLAARRGGGVQPGFSIAALERAQTGFAIVDIADSGQQVVSWFVLWPEVADPTWVTVVNARAAGSQPYFRAHLERLPLLRPMPTTATPPAS